MYIFILYVQSLIRHKFEYLVPILHSAKEQGSQTTSSKKITGADRGVNLGENKSRKIELFRVLDLWDWFQLNQTNSANN